jgi:glycine/D-amino acid oxidase-like deaminating enzyme/nitrite reductase/ring-hydroxylating ferredoxin subunit
VVGGGITGVTAALLLAQESKTVVLLESNIVGAGATGCSTGNLYATVSAGVPAVRKKWDADVARSVVASRKETVDFIEQIAATMNSRGGFERCDMYQYAGSPEAAQQVQDECVALQAAGLTVQLVDSVPLGPPPAQGAVLILPRQAQLHPVAYVQVLAEQAVARGVRIFENTAALDIDTGRQLVRTAQGTVRAKAIVLATHSPSGFHLVQAGLIAHREYGIAGPSPGGSFPPGIFWAQGSERLSIRNLETSNGTLVLCIGQDHKTGQHDAPAALHSLQQAASSRVKLKEVTFEWSAQNFQSPDLLPYIGMDSSGCYIATGFATDGLVYGTLAARIIVDETLGRQNKWAHLYNVKRFTPMKSARSVAEESAAVAKALVQDYLTQRQHEQLQSLRPGEGKIVEIDGERLAAFRGPQGQLTVVSPVCTHMKCIVHWNAVETSWDCPCHGSRFAPDGRVLEGPAIVPLKRKVLNS